MGFLYPRLLSGQAKPLHEAYRRMSLSELTQRAATTHDSAVYVATGGDRIPPRRLEELRERVIALTREAGFPNESTRERRADLDLWLAAALHAEMGIVPAEAASGDVWAFLALILLPDIAYWRYPQPPGDRIRGTDLTRHVFGRLWWRAHLVHSPEDPDPYAALKILGEAAFDQIYARRKALGGSPYLVKAILRVWNGLDLRGLEERAILRDFLKRLLRLAPFTLFEALDEHNLDAELRTAARESVTAVLHTFALNPDDLQARVDAAMAGCSSTFRNSDSPTAPASHGDPASLPASSWGPDRNSLVMPRNVNVGQEAPSSPLP